MKLKENQCAGVIYEAREDRAGSNHLKYQGTDYKIGATSSSVMEIIESIRLFQSSAPETELKPAILESNELESEKKFCIKKILELSET